MTAPDLYGIDPTGVDPPLDRTYEFDRSVVKPDSALRALWSAGLDVESAWLPVDYSCLDVRGGRLTIQLSSPDSRMRAHGYSLGTGRLACATTLVQYALVGPR